MANTVIKLSELPLRTQHLEIDEVVNIFGGCGNRGDKCEKDSDCCNNLCSDNNGPSGHRQCIIYSW